LRLRFLCHTLGHHALRPPALAGATFVILVAIYSLPVTTRSFLAFGFVAWDVARTNPFHSAWLSSNEAPKPTAKSKWHIRSNESSVPVIPWVYELELCIPVFLWCKVEMEIRFRGQPPRRGLRSYVHPIPILHEFTLATTGFGELKFCRRSWFAYIMIDTKLRLVISLAVRPFFATLAVTPWFRTLRLWRLGTALAVHAPLRALDVEVFATACRSRTTLALWDKCIEIIAPSRLERDWYIISQANAHRPFTTPSTIGQAFAYRRTIHHQSTRASELAKLAECCSCALHLGTSCLAKSSTVARLASEH